MLPWSQGYVTDTSYRDTFFRELSPCWLNYVAALNGARPRAIDRPFTYLELGCGFGSSSVVNAGAFPEGDFHACDFNPAHIEGGRRHAAALGIANIQFHESSFDDLASLSLPSFDFVALHGVYSWVGPEARQAIRSIIREALRPGGLVYLSYNCLPGWSAEVPLRRLLLELVATTDGTSAERTERALRSLTDLSGSKLRYFTANPSAVTAVESYAKGPSNYVVHEFLNQAWEPFYSIDVAGEMAEAGVSYLGSATLVDNHLPLVVDARSAKAVSRLATDRQRQLAIDFAVNQRFRRDVFVRGPMDLESEERARHLDAFAIGCLGDPEGIGFKAKVPRGEISFQEGFIRDLRRLMQQGSMTIGEIVDTLGARGDRNEILRNLTFLVAAGTLTPFMKAHTPSGLLQSPRSAAPILQRVLAYAIDGDQPRAVPSEVLGNGVPIRPIEAAAIRDWLAGADGLEKDVAEGLLASLIRVGLIT